MEYQGTSEVDRKYQELYNMFREVLTIRCWHRDEKKMRTPAQQRGEWRENISGPNR